MIGVRYSFWRVIESAKSRCITIKMGASLPLHQRSRRSWPISKIPRQLNLRGLSNFLAFGHAIAPETIYQNIYKLLPGHYLLAKNGHIQIVQYWDVGEEPQLPDHATLTEAAYEERILALLDDSVRRRMIADVPLGAFLSGGIDSSAVVALMKRHATGSVKTFSLGFSIGGAYNELSDAAPCCEVFGNRTS